MSESSNKESNSRRVAALALSLGALAGPVGATQLESAQDQLQEIRAQFATAFTPGAVGGGSDPESIVEFSSPQSISEDGSPGLIEAGHPQGIEAGTNPGMIIEGIIEGNTPEPINEGGNPGMVSEGTGGDGGPGMIVH